MLTRMDDAMTPKRSAFEMFAPAKPEESIAPALEGKGLKSGGSSWHCKERFQYSS